MKKSSCRYATLLKQSNMIRRKGLKTKTRLKTKKRINRKSKTPIALAKEQLWKSLRDLVRKRDGPVCVVCGKEGLTGANWHGGHFIPSSTCGLYLRYDWRNVHSSCYHCNINLGGNGAMFYRSLAAKYGEPFVENLFKDQQMEVKWGVQELVLLKDYYDSLIEKYDHDKLTKLTLEYNGYHPKETYIPIPERGQANTTST